MLHVDLKNGEYLVIKGLGNSNLAGPSQDADNAQRIKEWGVPGSKVKERITEKAEAKAAEDKELFMAAAGVLMLTIQGLGGHIVTKAQWQLKEQLTQLAGRYGFYDWLDAYKHFRGQENETT